MDDININEGMQPQSDELQTCKNELQQMRDRYLYLNAEFDNYKKRHEKERGMWIESAQDMVLTDMLDLVDDMERALAEMNQESVKLELRMEHVFHLKGFELIYKSLQKILKKYDVEEIAQAKTFDPEFFEAVLQVADSGVASGDIVSILQKGYIRKGRVLRPAKVSVAQ